MKADNNGKFISCDWGTSHLRFRVIQKDPIKLLGEHISDDGIAHTYGQWKKAGEGSGRALFFKKVLRDGLTLLGQRCGISTEGLPIMCSGMASSTMGIIELPYATLPFALDGSDAVVDQLGPSADLPNPLYIISGLKSDTDIMRGEETELTGIIRNTPDQGSDILAILPGTHSKHVLVQKGNIVGFQTYMTGEIFNLLAGQSTLRHSVEPISEVCWNSFEEGLEEARITPLLGSLFRVRVRDVLEGVQKTRNFSFLSGLVIGAELRELDGRPSEQIVIAGTAKLQQLYSHALQYLGFGSDMLVVPPKDCDLAAAVGQLSIIQHYLKRHD